MIKTPIKYEPGEFENMVGKVTGGGGPHMPSFIAGLILGIILTLAYLHFTAKPAETTEQKVLGAVPAAGDVAR